MNQKISLIIPGRLSNVLACMPIVSGFKQQYPNHKIEAYVAPAVLAMAPFFKLIDSFVSIESRDEYANSSELVFDLSSELTENNANPWSIYAKACTKNPFNAFHMSDVFRGQASFLTQDTRYELNAHHDAIEHAKSFIDSTPHIKVGLSISCLTDDELVTSIESLLSGTQSLQVYLLGTLREHARAKLALQMIATDLLDRCKDLTARTSEQDLAALSYLFDIMVSGAGLPLQLAAGFGTFCIHVAEANENTIENTAYGHGHIVIQKRESVNAKKLATLLAETVRHSFSANENGNPPSPIQWQEFYGNIFSAFESSASVYQNLRVTYETEANEEIILLSQQPLLFLGYEINDTYRQLYKRLFLLELANIRGGVKKPDVISIATLDSLEQTLKPLENLFKLCDFGIKYTNLIKESLKENNILRAKNESIKLQEVDDTISVLAETSPFICQMINFYQMSQSLLKNSNTLTLCDFMQGEYKCMQNRIYIVMEDIKSIYKNQKEFYETKEGL